MANLSVASAQVPAPGELVLDHVGHFVPDMDAASAALERMGFTLTPFSAQSHRTQPDGPLVPAGTGNRCIMLEQGYLEFLTATGDSPIADQLRLAMRRYVGVHLIAFGTATPLDDHARLEREGFAATTPVALQRPIDIEGGQDTARFTVVRTAPGNMPEGRIQFCQHHTPHLVWQSRWLAHANGATGLAQVVVCVADPDEAARRYSRYSALEAEGAGTSRALHTRRGVITFATAAAVESTLGVTAPTVPWIAGFALTCSDLAATRRVLDEAGLSVTALDPHRIAAPLASALGGVVIFQDRNEALASF